MKILFTLLSIESKNDNYLISAKKLINEILIQTKHDILLSTNNVDFFSDINDSRLTTRNNIDETAIFGYNGEFNYNLKYHAFKDIPPQYDYIIYLDCDIKLENWTDDSDLYIMNTISKYDFAATRLNCVLSDEIGYYFGNQNCLFRHKIDLYKILEKYKEGDDILKSQLPSEHFFILKNDIEKINMFQTKWKEQNDELQKTNCSYCSWGDGFEIGISARFAGLKNTFEVNFWEWCYLLGFKFNGNKDNNTPTEKITTVGVSDLTELANKFGSDKGTEHFERHSYTEIYQKYLTPFLNKKVKMLEIGVNDERFPGASIKMWTSFFSDIELIGFDINEESKQYENDNVKIFIGDQGNFEDLKNLIETYGGSFDIVIDDGSHQHQHHILTFTMIEPFLNEGAIYIIEDLHAYDGYLTKEWFLSNNKKHSLLSNDKLLIYIK